MSAYIVVKVFNGYGKQFDEIEHPARHGDLKPIGSIIPSCLTFPYHCLYTDSVNHSAAETTIDGTALSLSVGLGFFCGSSAAIAPNHFCNTRGKGKCFGS